MYEVFEKLQALQDILLQKYEIETEIIDIPKVLVTKNELLNRLKKQFIDKSGLLDRKQDKIKALRNSLREVEALREKHEKDMDIIKTQREYELLDKAIKEGTEKEQQFRKDILKEEKEVEELNQFIEREEQLINQQEADLKQEEERIDSESDEKKEVLKQLEHEERVIVPGLDEEILFKFERIIKNKAGLGIVPVKGSVCTGCHMILPAQYVNDVRLGEKILFCPYCSRILFYTDHEENSLLSFDDGDIGGFSKFDDIEDEVEDEIPADVKAIVSDDDDGNSVSLEEAEIFAASDDFEEEDNFEEEEDFEEEEEDDFADDSVEESLDAVAEEEAEEEEDEEDSEFEN
jgi:predicted  nucleic acid-binding Zn-ribbon protein